MVFQKVITGVGAICLGFLGACAEYPKNIEAAYIPSIIYNRASCQELRIEHIRLSEYLRNKTHQQLRAARYDTTAVTAGIVLLPVIPLVTLPATRDQTAQLAVARGHYNAIVQASVTARCGGPMQSSVSRQMNWRQNSGGFPPL